MTPSITKNLHTMAAALRARSVSSQELLQEALRRSAQLEPKLNAFITVNTDGALAVAGARDQELARGIHRGPLHGIPVALKDLMRTAGIRTTAGAKIFADYIPKRDAEVVTLLQEAGSVMLGKTGLHEFAYGVTSNNPHFGAIHNPWNLERVPGGSSGGSAVAVAAGIVPLATGTDTGGSIRVPASFCGIVGLKPTFGRVSVRGVLPLGATQDHVGPLTRTVRDAAVGFNALMGGNTMFVPPPYVNLKGFRIGWPQNFFFDRLQEEVRESVQATLQIAVGLEGRVTEITVPDMEAVRWAAFTTLLSEAASVLKPYLARREEFGEDVRRMVDEGLAIPAVDYLEAQKIRRKMRREFAKLFEHVDCIFTPATPITAPKIGQKMVEIDGHEEEVRAAATRFTRGMNALGFPAMSIPCGLSAGLPVGLQLIAAWGREDVLLHVGAAMEDALGLDLAPGCD